ncbi:hypothetical protein ACFL1M_01950 [Patescibacteria group bacterium]
MTKYSSTSATVANGDYLQIGHNQSTNDLNVFGWFYDTIDSLWKKITDRTSQIAHDLLNEFNPEHTQKEKVTSVSLIREEDNFGDGADGAITVSSNTSINSTSLIGGRSCADGGDAVNYNVSSLTSTTATLNSTPSSGCLFVGDEILLINQKGTPTAYVNVGNFETLRIESIATNTITFTTAKTKYYGDNSNDDSNLGTLENTQRVILQRVPNYTNVTVNSSQNFYPDDWDGTTQGGVMFFRATGTVTVNGNIHADGKGFAGGSGYIAEAGGDGGESFCADGGVGGSGAGATGAGGGGGGNGSNGAAGQCGGGGGGTSGGAGSASLGGAGGGGGGRNGGGGGAGYGTFGYAGTGSCSGTNGGTNTSGAAGSCSNGAPGGGGGTYGDANLEDLFMGSGGAGGGSYTDYTSGSGGDGGGVVYIAADTITVSGSVSSDGNNGGNSTRPAGGGGSGGSVKLMGNTLTLGSSLVTAENGAGGSGGGNGGAGGDGRVAVGYSTSVTGTSSPSYTSLSTDYNPFAVYVSEEVHTPGTTAFNNISWTEDLETNTEIQIQTRSGSTADSTDGSWEAWKPTTSSTVLNNGDTHTDFSGTNATVAEGDVARNVDYYEDEDESDSGNLFKVTATADNGYGEDTIASTDISGRDYVTFWLRATAAGQTVKVGFGEGTGDEQEETIYINQVNAWQKVYWDISDVAGASRNGVEKLRFTVLQSGVSIWVDEVNAESYLTTPGGSTISSTANDYIQYRAILTTTDGQYAPTLSEVRINLTNPDGTTTIDADSIIDPNEAIKNQKARPIEPETIDYNIYSTGDGSDGAITVSSNTSINSTNLISGRSCADGGDAVNYNVSSLTGTTATLASTPSSGCLSVGDEVLLINQKGTPTATVNIGNWETFRVSNVSSNVVTFTTAKTKYYGDNSNDDSNIGSAENTQRVILQRVPNYTNVTVNSSINFYPDDWDGTAQGGIMFFRATGTVTANGNIHADGKGYTGGSGYQAEAGGDGGEAFCADGGVGSGGAGATGAGGGAGANGNNGAAGQCGGGGGGTSGGAGSASLGGAGGGGGGRNGGGAGGGHGTFGYAGTGGCSGTNGGTNTSGAAGSCSNGAPGGGGGTYGDVNLEDLFMGSGGGGGGSYTDYRSGDGGDGGGVVFIAADTITVSGSISADGNNGGGSTRPAGGGGAGGSVKLMGSTLTLGSSLVTAENGAGGTSGNGDHGGAGGDGRVAIFYDGSVSGTSSPSYVVDTLADEHNPYELVISKEISTQGATSFGNIEWTENLATGTEIQFQTRSGDSTDSTDGTWESWGPTSSSTTLETANTHTNWTGTNATVADGDVTRNIDYYEDEDEGTAGNLTKFTTTAAGGFAEATISSTDISSRDYLTMWVRSSTAGSVITLGIGEAAATEQTQDVNIVQSNVWQKVYWDISDIAGASRNAITKLRVTSSENSNVVYIDNLNAQSYLTTPGGSTISSTADNYIQYRAILSTTDVFETPTLSEVRINYNDGSAQVVNDRLANQNWTDEINLDSRLRIITDDLDDIKSTRISKGDGITMLGEFDPGSGKDGDVTISSNTNINVSNSITGRSCSDGGDAVNYNVLTLTSNSATITNAPSDGCLETGDEILLINLQGTSTTFNNVGNYETIFIDSIVRDTIYFSTNKTKYYGDNLDDDSNLGTSTGTQRVMLQRVPHYENLTVNNGVNFYPSDWDGSKGGVVFFRASGAVAIDGTLHADGKGYRGGAGNYGGSDRGGDGGEAFCGLGGSGSTGNASDGAAGGGGGNSTGSGGDGLCGGGGGGQTAGSGSLTNGGSGGGGTSRNGGGGGGGYGSGGDGANQNGNDGGTNTSGDGGSGNNNAGGGGGGSYGFQDLNTLMYGSAGGGGGSYVTSESGGTGGDGGGIIYINANSITSNGYLSSDGNSGSSATRGGGGGGGGGSMKLIANKVNLGINSNTTSSGGSGGSSSSSQNGATAGSGRIAVYSPSASGTSSPDAYVAEVPAYNYSVFVSDEIPTANATEYKRLSWWGDTTQFGTIQLQTRSGESVNSTDNTWEAWKPVVSGTNELVLDNANTHTNWVSYNAALTVSEGDTARDVNFFEDEDESTVGNTTKFEGGAGTNMYAENRIESTDLTDYDFLTFWAYADQSGNVVKLGFGETDGNEHENTFHLDNVNTWQKFYWDISHIPDHEKDEVRQLRLTLPSTNYDLRFDDLEAERLMNDPAGSVIKSTPNEYLQYRIIMTSTEVGHFPTLYNVEAEWSNGFKIEQTDSNHVRLYNMTGEEQQLRLDAIVFGADLAEWYTVEDESIEGGDLVALSGEMDSFGVPVLRKAMGGDDEGLIGAISTQAGKELGLPAENRRLLGLSGRIPFKMDPDSPAISTGGYLTASPNKPGYAFKASPGDVVVGKVMQSWKAPVDSQTGEVIRDEDSFVLTYVIQPQSAPVFNADVLGFFVLEKMGDGYYSVKNTATDTVIKPVTTLASAVIGNLEAGYVGVQELVANQITAESVKSPLIEAERTESKDIAADIISPLTSNTLTVDLYDEESSESGTLAITGGDVTIEEDLEVSGNTRLENLVAKAAKLNQAEAEKLKADELEAKRLKAEGLEAGEATVSGTLYAENIESGTLDAQSSRIAYLESLSDEQKSDFEALRSSLEALRNTEDTSSLPEATLEDGENNRDGAITDEEILAEIIADTATYSATIAQELENNETVGVDNVASLFNTTEDLTPLELGSISLESLNSKTGNISTLMVPDQAIINHLSISSTAVVADNLLINSQSIQTLQTDTLFLQPTGGNINLAASTLTIDSTGQVQINGDLTVSGTIAAKDIETDTLKLNGNGPILATNNELDLAVKLATDSALVLQTEFDDPIATINSAGSASFKDLSLSASSSGTLVVPNGEKTIILDAPTLEDSSQVIITLEGDYSPATKYWITKNTKVKKFILHLDYPVQKDITGSWLVINRN